MTSALPSVLYELPIDTGEGTFVACYSTNGLAALHFPDSTWPRHERLQPIPEHVQQWHPLTVDALKRALDGRPAKSLPPLDLSSGTDFQRDVWKAMRRIPPGQTRSYGEIAHAIGRPHAVRAVGGACGANPIPVFVPCHRVLAANKGLGGFSSGLHWKRKLLTKESISFHEPRINTDLHGSPRPFEKPRTVHTTGF